MILNIEAESLLKEIQQNKVNFDTSFLNTSLFSKSWIQQKDFNTDKFLIKLKELKADDIKKSIKSKDIEITHIIFINYFIKNKAHLIELDYFLQLLKNQSNILRQLCSTGDFFIPRSLWWQMFSELIKTDTFNQ